MGPMLPESSIVVNEEHPKSENYFWAGVAMTLAIIPRAQKQSFTDSLVGFFHI